MPNTENIHPTAIIASNAKIGTNPRIGAYCVIGDNVVLGNNSHLHSHIVIEGDTEIGDNNEIFPFASIGTVPQDLKYDGEKTRTKIGNGNVIREHVTINSGTVQDNGITIIGDNCLLMIGSHIAHDCIVGNSVIMANNATLGGHVQVGNDAVIGGLSGIHQFVRIGHNAMIGGMSTILQDIIPFGLATGEMSHLTGINLVGLKRAGYAKSDMRAIMTLYKELFASDEGDFISRLADVTQKNDNQYASQILDFINAESSRNICTPA